MKKLSLLSILIFTFLICSNAQPENKDYAQMRDEGKDYMRRFDYPAAYKMFDGAEGFAIRK